MWYVIQIMTGKEEMMREMITRNLPSKMYEDCFYIRRERIWRLNGEKVCHVETMFPGYLFVTTEDPEAIYWKLREIPGLTKLLRTEESQFLSVSPEEQDFLEDLIDKDEEKIVRLSEVTLDEEKEDTVGKRTAQKVCKTDREKENTIMLCNDRKRTVWTEKEDIDRNPDRKDEGKRG